MADKPVQQISGVAVGYLLFAAIMLVIVGILQILAGLVALVDDEFYVATSEWVFEFDVTAWGWIHIIGGVVLVLAGAGLFSGNLAARVVAVVVAAVSVIANFAWLPYQPVWSTIMIVLAIGVIWALTTHGHDLADHREYS